MHHILLCKFIIQNVTELLTRRWLLMQRSLSLNLCIKKGNDAHLYSTTRSTVSPVSYQWNTSHYLPGRATPPKLGVKIPGSCQHTNACWGLTCLPSNAMALPVLILHLSGVKPCQFEARECSTQATSGLTLVSLRPATSHTRAKNHTIAPPRNVHALSKCPMAKKLSAFCFNN